MIETEGQIEAVARAVEEREVEGQPARAVVLAQTYATDLDDLWAAVTTAERIARWFTVVSGDLRLGGRYQLEGNAGGTVTACDPPRAFDATWEMGDAVSWIEVRLTAVDDDHTTLELTHIARPDDHWDLFGPGAVGVGWDLGLLGLATHLASDGFERPEADQWLATPGGRQFAADSGRAWAEAHIAGGEDADTARAASDRTIAAFTGAEPPPDP
jgi:uncharacterized protein YndB with AHSA1/START domain